MIEDEPFFPLPEADLRYAGFELALAPIAEQVNDLLAEVIAGVSGGETDG